MGIIVSEAEKQPDGFYRPTEVCVGNPETCYTSETIPKTSTSNNVQKVLEGSFYRVNAPLKYFPYNLVLPVHRDNTKWYIPKESAKEGVIKGSAIFKTAYMGSLTDDEVNKWPDSETIPDPPKDFCAELDPCPKGAKCCQTDANGLNQTKPKTKQISWLVIAGMVATAFLCCCSMGGVVFFT